MKFVIALVALLAVANANVVRPPLPSLQAIQDALAGLKPVTPVLQPTIIEPAVETGNRPSLEEIRERLRGLLERLAGLLDKLPPLPSVQDIKDKVKELIADLKPSVSADVIQQVRERLRALLDRILNWVNNLPPLPSLEAIKDAIKNIIANLRPIVVEDIEIEMPVLLPAIIEPTPVSVDESADIPPLVQIIVNVQGGNHPNPVAVQEPVVPEPVTVVEQPEAIIPTPVIVVEQPEPETILPSPVIVVEEPAPAPISVAEPVLPVPVAPVVLPENLN